MYMTTFQWQTIFTYACAKPASIALGYGHGHGIIFMALGRQSLSSSSPPSQHQGCRARLSKPAVLSLA